MGLKPTILALTLVLAACTTNPAAPVIPVYDLKMDGRSTGAAIVESGDNVTVIAKRYDLTIEDVIRANTLGGGNLIRPNQRLVLPPPRTYTVKRGDTLDRIARMFDTSEDALKSANPTPISEGQVLQITAPAPREHVAAEAPRMPRAPVETVEKSDVMAEPLSPQKAVKKQVASKGGRFAMPVDGEVISSYGQKAGGLYNDGINIAAKAGTPVKAAADGTVVFAGEGPEGFGNLVLVRHDDGYFSVYSHLSQIKAKEGASLTRGQTLGAVGATGKIKTPQLHFEIRKGTTPLDPEGLL